MIKSYKKDFKLKRFLQSVMILVLVLVMVKVVELVQLEEKVDHQKNKLLMRCYLNLFKT